MYQEDRLLALPICRGHYHLLNQLRILPRDFCSILKRTDKMQMSFFLIWKNDRQTGSQFDNSGLHATAHERIYSLNSFSHIYIYIESRIIIRQTILRSHFRQQEKTDLPVCYQIKCLSLEPKNSSLLVTVASDSVFVAKTACCVLTRDSKTKSLEL